ncbi:MAG: hypothetical protein J0G34_15605, partial [Afipia sp.]|nr:hypothetical protein [Afipia sp.]
EYGCEPYRAGAASCSASKAPSRSAPREQDTANLSAIQNAGIAIPITKCCSGGLLVTVFVIASEAKQSRWDVDKRKWIASSP